MRCKACNSTLSPLQFRTIDGERVLEDLCATCRNISASAKADLEYIDEHGVDRETTSVYYTSNTNLNDIEDLLIEWTN